MRGFIILVVLLLSTTLVTAQVKIVTLGTSKESTRILNKTMMNIYVYPANMDMSSESDWKAVRSYVDNLLKTTPRMYFLSILIVKSADEPSNYPKGEADLPWPTMENTIIQIRSHSNDANRDDFSKRCAWVVNVNNVNTYKAFPSGIMSEHWCIDVD